MENRVIVTDSFFVKGVSDTTNPGLTITDEKDVIVERCTFLNCEANTAGAAINARNVKSFRGSCVFCDKNSAYYAFCIYCIHSKNPSILSSSSFSSNFCTAESAETTGSVNGFEYKSLLTSDCNYSNNIANHITGLAIANSDTQCYIKYNNFASGISKGIGVVSQSATCTGITHYENSNFVDNDNSNSQFGIIRAVSSEILLSYCYAKNNKSTYMFSVQGSGKITGEYCCFDSIDSSSSITFTESSEISKNDLNTKVCYVRFKTCVVFVKKSNLFHISLSSLSVLF